MKPRVIAIVRWPVGGIRTWCRYVYRNSLFDDFSIDLVMPRVPESEFLERDLGDTNVNCRYTDSRGSTIQFTTETIKVIVGERCSLVHSHGFTSATAAYLPCIIKRVPHLITTHDVILDQQYKDFSGRMARRAVSAALRRADCVQAVSDASAKNLRAAFPRVFQRDKVLATVPNGIESERFLNAVRIDLKTKLDIPADTLVVGFFGRFMAQKGFKYLVEAVKVDMEQQEAARPPIHVVAVGSDGFRREEEAAITNSGLRERFRFMDFDPNIADTMRSVDVVAMPSLWEACGLLAMEALVAGIPLVASDCEALSDICRDTPAAIVRRADALDLLIGLWEQGTSSAREAADHYRYVAAERFDVAKTSAGIFDLYQRLLARENTGF